MLDCYTRFVLAWKIGIKKDGYNATKLFRKAVNRAGCLPVIFCSDNLSSYRKACQKVFNKKRGTKVIHWCDCPPTLATYFATTMCKCAPTARLMN